MTYNITSTNSYSNQIILGQTGLQSFEVNIDPALYKAQLCPT